MFKNVQTPVHLAMNDYIKTVVKAKMVTENTAVA